MGSRSGRCMEGAERRHGGTELRALPRSREVRGVSPASPQGQGGVDRPLPTPLPACESVSERSRVDSAGDGVPPIRRRRFSAGGRTLIHRSRQSWAHRPKGGLAWQEPRPTSYYRKWSNDPTATGTDMCGAVLELMAYQGPLADHILDGFEEVIAKDPCLTAHFRRQYRKVKALIGTPGWRLPFSSDPARATGTARQQRTGQDRELTAPGGACLRRMPQRITVCHGL